MRNGSVRASDADRERVAGSLRDHTVAGRLTTQELDERSGRAFAARTVGELEALLADLPRERQPAQAAALLLARGVVWIVVGVTLVTIAILWAIVWACARLARPALAAAARALDSGVRRAGVERHPGRPMRT